MNSEKAYKIPQQEIKLAEIIIDLIRNNRADPEKVIGKFRHSFTRMTLIKSSDSVMYKTFPAALISAQSDVLAKMYKYDGKIIAPEIICDIITFRYSGSRLTFNIIDAMILSDQYNLDIDNIISLNMITIDDIDYYVSKYNCYGIDRNRFSKLRQLIIAYVIISSSHLAKSIQCRCICLICTGRCNCLCRDGFDKHEKFCTTYKRYVQFPRILTCVLNHIPYDTLIREYHDYGPMTNQEMIYTTGKIWDDDITTDDITTDKITTDKITTRNIPFPTVDAFIFVIILIALLYVIFC
jgi:hypothetical protein